MAMPHKIWINFSSGTMALYVIVRPKVQATGISTELIASQCFINLRQIWQAMLWNTVPRSVHTPQNLTPAHNLSTNGQLLKSEPSLATLFVGHAWYQTEWCNNVEIVSFTPSMSGQSIHTLCWRQVLAVVISLQWNDQQEKETRHPPVAIAS